MIMKLAIIIGISEYDNINDLPSCKQDAEVISGIFDYVDEEWDKITITDSNTTSEDINKKIEGFIDKHKSSQIEQLFFYYSGHGHIEENEFYFVPTDFDMDRLNFKSISNEKIDSYLLQLNSELIIKIVDACYAGAITIKDTPRVMEEKAMKKSDERFADKNFYFFLSSGAKQRSFIEDENSFSVYTKRIIEVLNTYETNSFIKYRDIQAKLADEFNNDYQKPIYFMHGENTETFIRMTNDLKDYLSKELREKMGETITEECETEEAFGLQLAKLAEKKSKSLLKKEEFIELLNKITELKNEYNFNCDLREIFDVVIYFKKDSENIDIGVPAKWLKNSDHKYYVSYDYDEVVEYVHEYLKKPIEPNIFGLVNPYKMLGNNYKYSLEKIPKKRRVLSAFAVSSPVVPFNYIKLEFNNKFEGLPSYSAYIFYANSNEKITFFHKAIIHKPSDWENFEDDELISWKQYTLTLSRKENLLKESVTNIFKVIEKAVLHHFKVDVLNY